MADEPKDIQPPSAPSEDQAALDGMLAARSELLKDDDPVGKDYLADETPLGTVDAEGMLVQTPSALSTSIDDAGDDPQSVAVDDMDLDAMFSVPPEKYQAPPPAEETPAATLEEPVALPPLDAEAESPMSQDEIDAILQAATTPPPAPAALEETVEESAPDAEPEIEPEPSAIPAEQLDELKQLAETEGPAAPPEREEPAQHVLLDQSELDALVAGMADDAALVRKEMDVPVVGEGAPAEAVSLSQENVDSLLGILDMAPPVPAAEEAPVAPVAEAAAPPAPAPAPAAAPPAAPSQNEISQDMLDALIAAAATPAQAAAEIGSENLAAAATAADTGPAVAPPGSAPAPAKAAPPATETDDLDHLIDHAKLKQHQQAAKAYAATDPPAEKVRGLPRAQSPVLDFLSENAARVVASLAAGLLVGGATFLWLYTQQNQTPDLSILAAQRGSELEEAMDAARKMIDEGEYTRAAGLLEEAIDHAPAGRERTDAMFLRVEALYRGVPDNAPLARFDAVQSEIDGVLAVAPDHPRVPDALHWQARLHERGELPFAALDNYDVLINRYPEFAHMDEILVEGARLALSLGKPDIAARYADRLAQQFPDSPYYPEAKLLQGDAYARAGQRGAARQLYSESLRRDAPGEMQAEAVLRLGRLAYDEGNYDGAISQIRSYLENTTTAVGNDAAYLLLAQALRKEGREEEARSVLNNLLHFFPDSKLLPDAYVELTQTLEKLGERKGALQIANEGATRFPENPQILKSLGEMLGLDGNPFSAATTLIAAEEAGANDPAVLLTAARHFRTAGMLDESQRTYDRLLSEYGGSNESFAGGVELAEMIYERGDSKRALERLEKISTATEGKPQQLPALLAMADIYEAVGLPERVAEVSEKAAGLTDDPAVLARTASALIKAGELAEGQEVAERVDLAQVEPKTAYGMLSALGAALLTVDPPRGIEKLEEAYANYPEARQAEVDYALIEAYLQADRVSGARRVILDMAARAKDKPEDAPYLIDAASLWGDYLYGKNDFRGAADAYALADATTATSGAQVVDGKRTAHDWPRFQRANALLKLSDLAGSLALYDEIAQTKAPWAQEAAIKADFVRMQQRLRGESSAAPATAAAAETPRTQAG